MIVISRSLIGDPPLSSQVYRKLQRYLRDEKLLSLIATRTKGTRWMVILKRRCGATGREREEARIWRGNETDRYFRRRGKLLAVNSVTSSQLITSRQQMQQEHFRRFPFCFVRLRTNACPARRIDKRRLAFLALKR